MPFVKSLLRVIFLLLLTPVLLLLGCQSKLIYYPHPYDEVYRQSLAKHRGVPLEYQTGQGKQVAHYVPPIKDGKEPKSVWLCFGGNGTVALDWLGYIGRWDPEFAYLMVDYPGYGDCKGSPSPARIRESSKAAVSALASHLKLTPEQLQPRLRVLSHSIGCAAGLMVAKDLEIKKIILIAPFTTLTDMGRRLLGWPLCYINMHRFDNRRELARVVDQGAQVVIFHGVEDEVIPVEMGRELALEHPGKVTLHEQPGEDHNHILSNCSLEIGKAMNEMEAAK